MAAADGSRERDGGGGMIAPLDHRPWPPPRLPWVLFMRWSELAFLHWPVDPERLRRRIPSGLALDIFDGSAWLGITPFLMSGVRPRPGPTIPGISAFPELNVRTYVSAGGKPGIWFFSLDAASRLAVRAARALYHLPYHRAEMSLTVGEGREIEYGSVRRQSPQGVRFAARCRSAGTGDGRRPEPHSLEHWLTERYCLYSFGFGKLWRGEVHHAPWRLHPAEVEVHVNTMAAPLEIDLGTPPGLVHLADPQEVVAWMPMPVGRTPQDGAPSNPSDAAR